MERYARILTMRISKPRDKFVDSKKEFLRRLSPFHTQVYEKEAGVNVFRFTSSDTTIQFHGEGLGDLMIIRQFGRAFDSYLSARGDPGLGHVVIATGGFGPAIDPDPGDVNCYWWWSFGTMEDEPSQYLETYVDATEVLPDVILCPSKQCQREAEQLGFDTVRLPLGMESFRPLGLDRSGLGFAGAEHQRNSHKMDITIDPFRDDIEWVSDFVIPEQLNVWYNTKLITFGTHKEGQRQWGMVNNRVFETLGSGTPLVLESHPAIEDVLGIDYPYQTGSREETIGLVERIRENPGETVDDFAEIAEHIRKNHRYEHRVETLVDTLS